MKRIKWTGDTDIEFEADHLASSSSADGNRDRWTELDLYRTPSGTYLILGAGCSRLDGEVRFDWMNVQRTGRDVVRALTKRRADRQTTMTRVSRDLLEAASAKDSEIEDAFCAFLDALDFRL